MAAEALCVRRFRWLLLSSGVTLIYCCEGLAQIELNGRIWNSKQSAVHDAQDIRIEYVC